MLIRPATPADVPGMFHVRTAATENALSAAQLAELGITPAAIAQMLRAAPCGWVALDGDTVVGFSMVDLDEACLFAAFVLAAHEGRGIGTALIRAAEEALFARHARAWLVTAAASRAARLYRHLGWGHAVDQGDGDIRLEKQRPAPSVPALPSVQAVPPAR